MLHTSTQKLIQKICELTESGDIVWKEAPEGRCRFETEGYQIEVAEEPPLVRLLSPEGRELEKAEAADLAIAWPNGDGTFATHVVDMARRAHRVARGAEHAITKILSSLSAPPKKSPAPPEREPTSAAIEFDQPQSQPMARKPQQQSAGESAASIAALNADMVSQRRQPEPPPSPHTAPAPQPAPPPRPQTAVDAVLAAEASAPEAEPAIAAAEEELPLEDAAPAPVRTEPTPVQAAPVQAAPTQATLGQPTPRAPAPPPVEDENPAPADAPSFAQAQPPKPSAPLAKPASNLFMTGFSAVSRPAPHPEPQPAPPPAPAAKAAPEPPAQPPTPAPQPERPHTPEMTAPAQPPRTGQDIYKPW